MLRLDYEALADSSRTLIEQVIDALPDIWEAETCDRYVEQFAESKPTLNEVRNMIQEMAEQMQKISDNFREADADMAGQM